MSRRPDNLTDQPFGRLVVLGPGDRPRTWVVQCECGRQRQYGEQYLRETARHCGCRKPGRARRQEDRERGRQQAEDRRAERDRRRQAIADAWRRGESVAVLAAQYGVTREAIYNVVRRVFGRDLGWIKALRRVAAGNVPAGCYPPLTWCG